MSTILLVILVVALILAIIEVVRSRAQSLLAWAVVLIAAVLVFDRLPGK